MLLESLNVPLRQIVTSASNSKFSAIASAIGKLSTEEPMNTLGILSVYSSATKSPFATNA